MATFSTISTSSNTGVSMASLWPNGVASIDTVLDFAPTVYRLKLTNGTTLSYIGSGFTYASVGKIVPISGSYSQVQLLDASGELLALIQAFGARNASEILQGNPFNAVFSGADSITGGPGADSLIGEDGNDTINGGQGNDTIASGNGFDVLDGGEGIDTHIMTHFNSGVEWDMTSGRLTFRGYTEVETAINFENVILGNGTNTIIGTSGPNLIVGGGDLDIIYGGGGNDTIAAGNGFDEVFGGEGVDTYDMRHFNGDVTWFMDGGRVSFSTTPNNENALEFEIALMGNGNDSVQGNNSANRIEGNGGNDTLNGGAGSDTLVGGSGNDLYIVDSTGDVIIEEGGDATDAVNTTLALFVLGLTAGSTGVERLTFIGTGPFGGAGTDANNVITGGSGNDLLVGNGGNDTLVGGLGDDSLEGGANEDLATWNIGDGNDVFDGGDGFDTLVINAGETADTFQIAINAGRIYISGTSPSPFTIDAGSIESITFFGKGGNDRFTGSGQATSVGLLVYGEGGNDSLTGGTGRDTLLGDADNDTLNGGAGVDTLEGGEGDDWIVYDAADFAANVNGGFGTDTLWVIGGSAPTSFDLAARGFEAARHDMTDTTNQSWSLIFDSYSGTWQRITSDIRFDDGTRQVRNFDHLNNQTYSEFINQQLDVANPNALTKQFILFDNGTRQERFFDYLNNQNYVEYINDYADAARSGSVTRQVTFADNGTKQERFFDYLSNQNYVEYINDYADAARPNSVTRQVTFFDNGTRQERFFDYLNNQPAYSEYINFYNTAGQITRQVGFNNAGAQAWEYFY